MRVSELVHTEHFTEHNTPVIYGYTRRTAEGASACIITIAAAGVVAASATVRVAVPTETGIAAAAATFVARRTTWRWGLCASRSGVSIVAVAAAVNAAAMSPAIYLHWKLAVVKDRFAHASAVAFVALTQTVDTRAVRSTAFGPIGADAVNPQAENERQPGITTIDHSHHSQLALA